MYRAIFSMLECVSHRESFFIKFLFSGFSCRMSMAVALSFCAICSTAFAQESEHFRIIFHTDSSISFWDPESSGSKFESTLSADGSLRHEIIIDQPLHYRDCRLKYRLSREVRVRWQPPEGFSRQADDHYEIVVTLIEPTDRQRDSVEIDLTGPEGFTRRHLEEYETKRTGQGLESARLFFPAAFLAQHFSAALPPGHGLTRRMANASVDHLVLANKFLSNINLQPGFPFEDFIASTVAGDSRGEKTISSLRDLNVSFFRDIRIALRDINDKQYPEYGKCQSGLAVLKELSQCLDAIAISEPELLADSMRVVNSNTQEAAQGDFDFSSNIAASETTCAALPRN